MIFFSIPLKSIRILFFPSTVSASQNRVTNYKTNVMKKTLTLLLTLFTTLSMAQFPQKDLLFHFPFNGNMTDAGPNAITGNIMTTTSGGVTLDADKNNDPNKCYYFSGGYVDMGMNDKLTIGDSSFTFVAWICNTSYSGALSIFANNFGFLGGISIGLKNGVFFAAVGGGTMPNSISVNVVNDDKYRWNDWHHVAVVLNRATKKFCIYVDGVKRPLINDTSYGPYGGTITGNELDFTGLPLNLTSVNTNALGAYLANGRVYQNFLGLMDDVALYKRALSESEVTSIYSGVVGLAELTTEANGRVFLNDADQTVSVKGLVNMAELTVYGLNGTRLATTHATSIHVASLPKGLYILRVNDGSTTFTEKFRKR